MNFNYKRNNSTNNSSSSSNSSNSSGGIMSSANIFSKLNGLRSKNTNNKEVKQQTTPDTTTTTMTSTNKDKGLTIFSTTKTSTNHNNNNENYNFNSKNRNTSNTPSSATNTTNNNNSSTLATSFQQYISSSEISEDRDNLKPINEEATTDEMSSKDKSAKKNNSNHNSNDVNMQSSVDNNEELVHVLGITTYFEPTNCDYCFKLLTGLVKQGVKCQVCSQNFHKNCVQVMPAICNKRLKKDFENDESSTTIEPIEVIKATELSSKASEKMNIEHSFVRRELYQRKQFLCNTCNAKFKEKQDKIYLHCQDCKINVHERCEQNTEKNCKQQTFEFDTAVGLAQDMVSIDIETDPPSSANVSFDQSERNDMPITSETNSENKDDLTPMKPRYNRRRQNQIRLQRVSQRVKKSGDYFWQGYMLYSTSENDQVSTCYWQLDSKQINAYDNYKLVKKLFEIPLSSIHKAPLCESGQMTILKDGRLSSHKYLFSLITENITYYCGLDTTDYSGMNQLARNFYNIFKMVYLPYQRGGRQSIKINAPKYEHEKDFNEEFTINPQESLGSGQFGHVYGGICKATGQQVAIKLIDKSRYQDETFRNGTTIFQNEVLILCNFQHPGVVKLHALFDIADHLYIVTERLATDMLEMILSRKPPRLTERAAKFITYQILIALNFLHSRSIAHCDLKPENILLTENVEFPQVKLCDFGYAKIIGENSFRRSLVGTPAYSPPEVKQRKVFNKSMDMWSMGVIVYVSLSGVFPFEEDRDIYEQIKNSNFMFPADPWDTVSEDAIDLIKKEFLQVSIATRAGVSKALRHRWFSEDYQLYLDLQDLETRVNQKWLTTKEQEEKWDTSHL